MPTREQERAAFALAKVEACKGNPNERKYRTQLVKFPSRLHTNGLGQTAAFYLAAGESSVEVAIVEWLQEWLRNVGLCGPNQRLIQAITTANTSGYRRAASEARALSGWLKRFAEAFLQGEDASS